MCENSRQSSRRSSGADEKACGRRKRLKRRLRVAFLLLCGGALFLIFAWFFLTGSFFLTTVALPFLGSRIGVEIAADRAEFSLFRSRVAFENLRIGPEAKPIFSADRAEGRFGAAALRGIPVFSEVTLDGAALTLYYHASGGMWSIYPKEPEEVAPSEETGRPSSPFRIDLSDVKVRNSRFRMIFGAPEAGSAFELSDLNFSAGRFANGQPFAIDGAAGLRLSSSRANHIDSGEVKFTFASRLDDGLAPEEFQGNFLFSGLFGSISGEPLNDGSLELAFRGGCRNDRLTLEKFTLTQSQGGKIQSDVELSGEAGFQPFEIRASVDVRRLSEEVTSLLFDLGFGFNPGRAFIQYRGNFSYGGRRLTANGTLRAERSGDAIFGLERIALPTFQLDGEHDFEIDLENSTIDLRRFALELTEKGSETASFRLRRPIRYSWLPGSDAAGQRAVFDLECNAFDLKLLRLLTPGDSSFRFNSGTFHTRMQLTLQHNLSAVSLLGRGRVVGGSCRWEERDFELAELIIGLDMELRRDFHWKLRNLSLALKNTDTELGSSNFSGEGELTDLTGKLSGKLERLTPELAAWLHPPFAAFLPEYRKLKLGTLEVNFTAEKPDGRAPFTLKTLTAGMDREGKRALELKTGPYRIGGESSGDLKLQLTGQLPVTAFRPWLDGDNVRLGGGNVKLALEGSLAHDFRSSVFSGELSLEELSATVGNREFRDFSGQCAFSCYMPGMRMLEFRMLNFYLRRFGKPALRLECPGVWDLNKRSYSGEWSIRYLNEQFLELVMPGKVSEAQLTGQLMVAARNDFRDLRVAGAFDLVKLILPPGRPSGTFSGSLSLAADLDERQLLLRRVKAGLRREKEKVFDLEGECRVDLASPEGAVTVQLAGSEIDAPGLLALIPPMPEPEKKSGAPEAVPQLDFGLRPIDFGCRLTRVRFSPELTADLDTRLHLRQDSLSTDHLLLQVNNARYDGEFRGTNMPQGIAFSTELRGNEPLSVPPLMELIVGTPQTGAGGTLREFNLNLRFLETGRPDSWLETLSGALAMDLYDVRIPHTVTNGPFSRLLLFPIEMAGQLDTLLPDDVAAWKEYIVSSGSLNRQLKTVELSEGKVRLHASDGKVRVDECAFFGDWVSRLIFTGEFNLAGTRRLQLVSKLTVGGLQTTIPIQGTLEAPEVRLGSVASGSLGALLRKIRDLKLIGTSADPVNPNKIEPVIMIDKLPSAGTVRELHQLFKGLWKK